MRPAANSFLRPHAIARSGVLSQPPLAETGTVKHARIAPVDREVPRSRKDRARLKAVEPADRMAEMRRIGVADVLRQMGEIDVFVDEMQQMPRALPGAKRAKRDAGLLLEQMQESRRRQTSRCGAVGRRHLDAGEIIEPCGGSPDALIDVAIGQTLAEKQLVELAGGKAATALAQAQGVVSVADSPRELRRSRSGNSCAQVIHRRWLDRFRFDHQADDRGMLAFDAVGRIGRNHRHLADRLGLAPGDFEASLHRGIDVESTAGALARPAQQARIKHPFGADQHQPPGLTAIPVIHVRLSPERSLLLAASRGPSIGALPEYSNRAGCHRRINIAKCRRFSRFGRARGYFPVTASEAKQSMSQQESKKEWIASSLRSSQ